MKVIYLIDSLEGYGAEKSIVQIAMGMEKVTPVFIHLYRGEKLKLPLLKAGIKVYSLNIDSAYGYKEALELIQPLIEKEKPQIIHSTLFRADMVSRKLKVKFPDIILVGSFVSNSYGKKRYSEMSLLSRFKLFTTQCIDRLSADKVDYFVCNSKAIMKTNVKALGIPKNKIFVIYRGRSFRDFCTSKEGISKLQEELQLEGKLVFLNVGRLIRSKGHIDLLLAFKQFLNRHPNSILLIAGEGPLRFPLVKRIKNMGLEENVILLGYREDIPKLLQASDFFVFPSYFEGLPGALIEAIIAKKPCIVSDIPENRECFGEESALFFPPGNIKALTTKMEEAIKLKDWNQKLGNSFAYAEKNFKIKNISAQYELFYKNILIENTTSYLKA